MHSILLILKLSPKGKNIKITNLLDVLSITHVVILINSD